MQPGIGKKFKQFQWNFPQILWPVIAADRKTRPKFGDGARHSTQRRDFRALHIKLNKIRGDILEDVVKRDALNERSPLLILYAHARSHAKGRLEPHLA